MTDPRLTDEAESANEILLDRAIRHAVYLERLKTGEAGRLIRFLREKVFPDVLAQIERRVARIAKRGFDTGPRTTERLRELAREIGERLGGGYKLVADRAIESLRVIAVHEADFTKRMVEDRGVDVTDAPLGMLTDAVKRQPVLGTPVRQLLKDTDRATRGKIMQAVRLGLVEGKTIDQIVSAARQGLESMNGRLETVVRTAVTHVASRARLETFRANSDILKGWRFVATLDTRTTLTCASLDGRVFAMDDERFLPPRHPNCRSTQVPILKSLKDLGINAEDATPGQRASMTGQVPDDVTYGEWLKRQSAAIQDEALGPTRGRLFRSGDLEIRGFVDNRARPLTIERLMELEKAG